MRHMLIAALGLATASFVPMSARAAFLPGVAAIQHSAPSLITTAQGHRGGAAQRGFVARGPRGGVVAGRGTAVVRPGYRPGYRPVRPVPVGPVVVAPGWRRPRRLLVASGSSDRRRCRGRLRERGGGHGLRHLTPAQAPSNR
jgi:hypothetical protein